MTTLDFTGIAQNILILAVAIVSAWTAGKAKAAQKATGEAVRLATETKATAEKIYILSNHAMQLQKKALAEVTAAKAAITHSPKDEQDAADAMRSYLAHVAKQSEVDGLNQKP